VAVKRLDTNPWIFGGRRRGLSLRFKKQSLLWTGWNLKVHFERKGHNSKETQNPMICFLGPLFDGLHSVSFEKTLEKSERLISDFGCDFLKI
jgi:hypothetical protein